MTSFSDVEREIFMGRLERKIGFFRPEDIYDEVLGRIINGGKKLIDRIGDPMDSNTLYGPMHNQNGVDLYLRTG